jgi:hypothetical protein
VSSTRKTISEAWREVNSAEATRKSMMEAGWHLQPEGSKLRTAYENATRRLDLAYADLDEAESYIK